MVSKNLLYSQGFGIGVLNQTRMRLGISALRAHLFKYNIIDSPLCTFCNMANETEIHFILHCPTFAAHRTMLLANLVNDIPFEILSSLSEKNLVCLLLKGSDQLDKATNQKVFEQFHIYIKSSKRFEFNQN